MKFKIESTYSDQEELIDDYPVLEKYGFEVIEETKSGWANSRIIDENGEKITQKRKYTYTTKDNYVTIDTLEQLMSLIKDVCHGVIIGSNSIEIYDGYRE